MFLVIRKRGAYIIKGVKENAESEKPMSDKIYVIIPSLNPDEKL